MRYWVLTFVVLAAVAVGVVLYACTGGDSESCRYWKGTAHQAEVDGKTLTVPLMEWFEKVYTVRREACG